MESRTFQAISIFSIILAATAIGIAIYDEEITDPQIQANQDNISTLFSFKNAQVILNNDFFNRALNNTADIQLVNDTAQSNKLKLGDHDRQLAFIEAGDTTPKNQPTTPQGCKTGDMNLLTTSADPNDFRDSFFRGEIVYVTGKTNDGGNTKFEILNIGTAQIIGDSSFIAGSDGSFTKAWITESDQITGQYRILLDTLGGPKDCVEVTIKQ